MKVLIKRKESVIEPCCETSKELKDHLFVGGLRKKSPLVLLVSDEYKDITAFVIDYCPWCGQKIEAIRK